MRLLRDPLETAALLVMTEIAGKKRQLHIYPHSISMRMLSAPSADSQNPLMFFIKKAI
jgi:hypothetical protein